MLTLPLSEDRVRKNAEKLQRHLNAKQQGRLDGFFTKPAPKAGDDKKGKGKAKDDGKKGTKRKNDAESSKAGGSKKKTKKS